MDRLSDITEELRKEFGEDMHLEEVMDLYPVLLERKTPAEIREEFRKWDEENPIE